MARTRFTKLSTRLGRSLRREEQDEEGLTKLCTLGVLARLCLKRTCQRWKLL